MPERGGGGGGDSRGCGRGYADNFTPDGVRRAAASLKQRLGRGGEGFGFLIEVSGGLTEENVREYVSEDVDVVSTSSVHQGVGHVDFSLKVIPESLKGSHKEKARDEGLEQGAAAV